MKESVIYQSIVREVQEKVKEEGRLCKTSLIIRQIKCFIGEINPNLENQIQKLSFNQLDDLSMVLLDFQG